MRAKNKIILSSLLAVGLALGLGFMSLGLFGATPPITPPEIVLDLYTQQGGIGPNASGGFYQPLDTVSLYAYFTSGGIGKEGIVIAYKATAPDAREIGLGTATTNGSGIASLTLSLLPSAGRVVGTWEVIANTTADGTPVVDELTLVTQTEEAQLTLVRKRNGVPDTTFLPNETVLLEAKASYRNASLASFPINFTVLNPNGTALLTNEAVPADADGVANVTFQIPWPSNNSLGIWMATAQTEIYEQLLNVSVNIECKLLPVTIDVFTSKGGYGQNTPGGTYVAFNTVPIYAQIKDQFNKTAPPGLFVGIELRNPASESIPAFGYTNETGMTEYIHPYRDAGAYFVIVTATYVDAYDNDVLVHDTLTFTIVEPLP
jgi:hypothetical protein